MSLIQEQLDTEVGKIQLFRGGSGSPLVYLHSAGGDGQRDQAHRDPGERFQQRAGGDRSWTRRPKGERCPEHGDVQ